jgi:hypothetical protein
MQMQKSVRGLKPCWRLYAYVLPCLDSCFVLLIVAKADQGASQPQETTASSRQDINLDDSRQNQKLGSASQYDLVGRALWNLTL